MIKILHLISSTGLYGAERWVLALARNLDPGQVSCGLGTLDEPGQSLELHGCFRSLDLPAFKCRMRGKFNPLVIPALARLVRAKRIDVIHSHGYKSDILGLAAARLARVRCVSTPHGFGGVSGRKMQLFVRLGCAALRCFDCVAPLSEELAAELARIGIRPSRIRLILNGVDIDEIDSVRNAVDLNGKPDPEARPIVYIGRLDEGKNVADLIGTFDLLFRVRHDVSLWLIGDGEQRGPLEQLARSLASSPRISFLGYRSDRLELLRRAALFAMTSSSEGIPRCLMEAMAMGVPVAAYDVPGVSRLVRHEETGLLAPFGDIENLKNCFNRILSGGALARQLASAAREQVAQDFSAQRMAHEFTSLYSELTADPNGQGGACVIDPRKS